MFQIIMAAMMLPCILIVYFIMKDLAKPKGYVVLGATVNASILYSSSLEAITAKYKRNLRRGLWLLLLLFVPICFIPSFSIAFTFLMVWVMASVILPMVFFAQGNIKIQELKREQGCRMEQQSLSPKDMETMAAPVAEGPSLWLFLPPLLLCLIPGIGECIRYDQLESPPWLLLWVTMLSCCLLFFSIAYLSRRTKTQIISTKSSVNFDFAKEKKQLLGRFWLLGTWLLAIFTLCLWLLYQLDSKGTVFLPFVILYSLLLLLLVFRTWKKYRQLYDSFHEKTISQPFYPEDNDKGWIWGLFYYNPKDPHLLVEERAGMGNTINMGRPAGKVLTILLSLCLLIIPASCVLVTLNEFTPMRLSIEEHAVTARQWRQEYRIPLEDIQSVDLIQELHIQNKLNGSAVAHKDKGLFRTKEYGRCHLFLINTNQNFLVLTTEEETYLFCDQEEEKTLQIFEQLQKLIPVS
ncbi:MAG: DUF5808 domain-containing protein [Blautia sp.]|jgi:uncharacterized membrane protein